MIQVIAAPSVEKPLCPSVFLAGGITKCQDWQNEVIKILQDRGLDKCSIEAAIDDLW